MRPSHGHKLRTLAALAAMLGPLSAAGQVPAARPSATRSISVLLDQVRAKDPSAITEAARLGASATPSLVPLTHDHDADVREIALLCLAETGGHEAIKAFVDRVADPEPSVRAAALRGLSRRAGPADVPALIATLGRSQEPTARSALAVLIGRLGTAADVAALRTECERHKDGETRLGCTTALAWLGDRQAQDDFNRGLVASRDRERLRYLEYAEQIKARWLLPALVVVLDDSTPLRWIGVDGGPPPESLRACDIALNLVAAITERRWAFTVAPRRNYSAGELAEVREYLKRRP
jgi:HEAT repeats